VLGQRDLANIGLGTLTAITAPGLTALFWKWTASGLKDSAGLTDEDRAVHPRLDKLPSAELSGVDTRGETCPINEKMDGLELGCTGDGTRNLGAGLELWHDFPSARICLISTLVKLMPLKRLLMLLMNMVWTLHIREIVMESWLIPQWWLIPHRHLLSQ
jgi:hypothetical protein